MTDDELMLDMPIEQANYSRNDVASEALTLALQGSLPRLVLLLVWLGHHSEARALLALQSSILAALTRPARKPRS